MNRLRIWEATVAVGAILLMTSYAAASPGVVTPYVESGMPPPVGGTAEAGPGGVAAVPGPGIQAGADHIVDDQCGNGGWGWSPHGDCSATYHNITGPICLGLLDAHAVTYDLAHLNAAIAGGDYDIAGSMYANGEARFGTFTPYFMWVLSTRTGDPTYSDYAATKFFDELTAGTYGPGDYDTAGWIAAVQAGRSGTWVNLRAWEFQTLIHAASAMGNPGQAELFHQALLDGLNTLVDDPAAYYDLLGLAGGVRGLAMSGTTSFAAINSPQHAGINGIDNLKDLADALAGYQNADGSWYWHSNLGAPVEDDKSTQVTAYAVLALRAAVPLVLSVPSSRSLDDGSLTLFKMQEADGSFVSWAGTTSKNTEVEAEALSAISGPGPKGQIPTVSQVGLIVMGVVLLVLGRVYFGRRRAKAA